MAQKRRRFGRVCKLRSGRWQARYRGPDGIDHPAPHTFATMTDAAVWLTDKEAEIRRGDWIDPDSGMVPLSEFGEAWIAERPNLRPRTVALYEGLFRLHLQPDLGSLGLAEITPSRVRTWRKARLDSGLGPVTVAKAYRLLKAIMNTAVDDGLIRRNPCRIKGAGTERSPERPNLTIHQVYAIADAIEPRYKALVLVATFASLRWGELMGLRQCDLDLDTCTVHVRRAVQEIRGKQVVGLPKSAAGIRSIAIPESILADLRWHLRCFAENGATGRVFVGPKGATPRRCNFQKYWSKAITAAGLPDVHIHDLRHAGSTMAASTGASLRELMERQGQTTERAALIYQHASKDRDRAIADALDALIEEHRRQSQEGGEDDDPPLAGAATGT